MIKALYLLTLPFLLTSGQADILVDYGSNWRFFVGTTEASSPDSTAWRGSQFDDTAWNSGPAVIGYANPPTATTPVEQNIATLLPDSGTGGYLSVFFRRPFTVADAVPVQKLILNVNVDDGFIAWINGVEVGRYNVADGEPAFNWTASSVIEATLVTIEITNNLSTTLRAGTNMLAVQVFNANSTSSDLIFDATLASDMDQTAPVVAGRDPIADATVQDLTTVEVSFSENVVGVDAADLLINGVGATGMTAASPLDYTFTFPQPSAGVVTISWSANHGITDSAGIPFAGTNWTYTLDTNVPPPAVVISEFMADNADGIKDDDGHHSDWLELFNMGDDEVNLDGWFLSVDPFNDAQWRLPAIVLGPKSYLLIWASGNDRTNPTLPLHTNFKLNKDGAYLRLSDPGTNVVSAFAPAYPGQTANISYGRDTTEPDLTGFFSTPTPGTRNLSVGAGFAPEPIFSVMEGVFTNASISVRLSAPSGQIRFTTDGTLPTATSPLYSNPLTLSTTTTIKARVFQTGFLPSTILARNYVFLDSTVANFTSNLPLMIFSTTGRAVADHPPAGTPRTFASLIAIPTFRGRSSGRGSAEYFGQCELGIRGQTSSGFPKQPYRLELQDEYRFDRKASLFGLPASADFVLNNPYSDKPFIQNYLAQELFEQMGHYAVRRRFVEVFLNTSGGKIKYPGDYVGVYLLLEKIKVADDRVNIAKLTPYDQTEPDISGGYMFKKDKDSAGDLNFSTSGGGGFSGQYLKVHEPSPRTITPNQVSWLTKYLNQFEKSLYATNWLKAAGTNHYSYYMESDSFVDYQWIVEFSKQIDGYRLSNYMQKDRNGKVKMEPIWDWNLSFGNANYLGGDDPTGWYWTQLGDNDHIWLRRLMCGTTGSGGTSGDPDFVQKVADRWSVLRTNIMSGPRVLARIDELAASLNEAATRDFARWPRLGQAIWPNPTFYITPTNYAGIIAAMKTYVSNRYKWIDGQFVRAPVLSSSGGRVAPGYVLTITGANTIYFTTDGSDPRLPGGAISAKAIRYSGPITLGTNARVVARSVNFNKWTGPAAASFQITAPPLALTEIMYHPAAAPAGSIFAAEDFEFLEFRNLSTNALPLAGYKISEAVDFTFPAYRLEPGGRVLVVKNRAAFESRYGTGLPVTGEYAGNLDNQGERIVVTGPLGEPVLDVSYSDEWAPVTDGAGFSLVLADENISAQLSDAALIWRAGSAFGGTPGYAEAAPATFPRVVISEVLSHPIFPAPDQIELQNLESFPVSIGGWFLSDDRGEPAKYRIPEGTIVPPGGFFVVSGNDFSSSTSNPFGLSSQGDEVYLSSAKAAGELTGYMQGFKFDAQAENVSFGRYVDSVGREQFVAQTATTLGSLNAGPVIPPIAISEIMYHPKDVSANGSLWSDTEDEYIELYNRTDQGVALFDEAHTTNCWRIAGDVEFTFATNTVVPAESYLVVVSFDPVADASRLTAFRAVYNLPAGARVVGPFSGQLNNSGGTIALFRPDVPAATASDAGKVPFVLAEQFRFSAEWPWLAGADGFGLSLHRADVNQFADDPNHWVAAKPTPGSGIELGTPPVISEQPRSQLVAAGKSMSLQVVASGATAYQWRVNGQNINAATNSILALTNAQPSQSGTYTVIVTGDAGVVSSEPARVTIERDSDADGLPDDWELAYGFNPFDPTDASGDSDNDGVSNRDEYIAGTNPRDPQSYLFVQDTHESRSVWFQAAPNRSYSIQYADGLNTDWRTLTNVVSGGVSAPVQVTDPAPQAQRYYRMVTPAQP